MWKDDVKIDSQDSFDKLVASSLDGEHGVGGFRGALLDAEMSSVFDAKQKIDAAPNSKKLAVLTDCLHNLRESLVAEIQNWVPKYVGLAATYPQYVKSDPIEWARDRVQKVIDERLRKPDLNGAIAFYLITVSGGDIEEKEQWCEPSWMRPTQGRKKFNRSISIFFQEEHHNVQLRLNHALAETLTRLKIDLAINNGDRLEARHQPVMAVEHTLPAQRPRAKTNRGRRKNKVREKVQREIAKLFKECGAKTPALTIADLMDKNPRRFPLIDKLRNKVPSWSDGLVNEELGNTVKVLISQAKGMAKPNMKAPA